MSCSFLILSTFTYCLFGVKPYFKVVLEVEASRPPRFDLKVVSVVETTFLYDAWYSVVLLRPKHELKLPTQSAEN